MFSRQIQESLSPHLSDCLPDAARQKGGGCFVVQHFALVYPDLHDGAVSLSSELHL